MGPEMSDLTFGSLFAGVGGFDLGMEAAGWSCAWQVEWDAKCQQVLARHWPDVPRWGDVCDLNGAQLPPVDCVTFGSPCQDLSVAGKRAGLDGERSGLFFEAIRIIEEMRDATDHAFPRWAVWENVAGALSSNRGADFGAVLDTLADAGALVIEWAVLDARWFGVPQRRRRVFVVACFDPATADGCPDPLLPVWPRSGWHPPTSDEKGTGFTTALTGGLGSGGPDAAHAAAGWLVPVTSASVAAKWAKGTGGPAGDECQNLVPFVKVIRPASDQHPEVWREEDTAPTLNSFDNGSEARATVLAFSENQRGEVVTSDYAHQITAGGGKPGQGYPAVLTESWVGGSQQDQFVHEDDVAPTLAHSSNHHGGHHQPKVVQNAQVRRLTPVECERLMGWPDDHTRWTADGDEIADSHRYRMCGNGVASPVAAWIGTHLANATEARA
jgi:DNA (cytosine-5)-methyltransferase 1